MMLKNPIIPGFAPDPSIVLVNDTYYLVNSSFHIFPGLPIYTSTNLTDWRLRGHAICRPSQLDLSRSFVKYIPLPHISPLVVTGGLFAPTIRFHDGEFHIVCTNAIESEKGEHIFANFIISCTEAEIFSNGWSDPKYFDFPGIDPSLFFDHGRAYLQGSYRTGPPWAPDCSIRQFEIDVRTGRAMSPIALIWQGATKDTEGPHMYHRDGWYYLMTAEGSTFEEHEIDVARSRSVWGPFEVCPHNPLLTAAGREEAVRWTGHGDLFSDSKGNWWCVHLGIRFEKACPGRHPLGRETFLTPVVWTTDEWPSISQTKLELETPLLDACGMQTTFQDSPDDDLYIRTPNLEDYTRIGHKRLLRPQQNTLSVTYGSLSFVGRRQRSLKNVATTSLRLSTVEKGIRAGISVYKDNLRYASITYDATRVMVSLEIAFLEDDKEVSKTCAECRLPSDAETINLRIQASPEQYTFAWSHNVDSWNELANIDSALLCGYDMTGTIFGIFATSSRPKHFAETWPEFSHFNVE